ncbi:UBX domain-containing protein 1-A [Biomphalaria pfeifferi]|uniref:UBX domain-containing protein 1-A n=1 Tax=Biomphalaria pfeifferi TaxID=112525 RepID=A0AAD8FAA4_BIOPF|nr:UBX domain-containing protein 1-A [Biomphalaria pfeifferi]
MERERRETETTLKEKEAEIAIAKERERKEAEIAKEKEITLREIEKEKQKTERERIAADKENEATRQASFESRPASPASSQGLLNGLPYMPMEHFDDKTENIDRDRPANRPTNLAPKTPQHNQAPGRQSAPHNHNNRPKNQSRYNQANYSQRDSRHGARDSRPTPHRQQQAPRTLSMVMPVPQPSAIDPSDQPDEDTYVVSTMAVAPQPTAIDLSQPELSPVLPHPSSSPPGVETVVANVVEVLGLYDSGCSFSAVINKTLIDPSDLTGRTVTIQSIDRGTPPQVLLVARVHVECE